MSFVLFIQPFSHFKKEQWLKMMSVHYLKLEVYVMYSATFLHSFFPWVNKFDNGKIAAFWYLNIPEDAFLFLTSLFPVMPSHPLSPPKQRADSLLYRVLLWQGVCCLCNGALSRKLLKVIIYLDSQLHILTILVYQIHPMYLGYSCRCQVELPNC